MSITFRYQLVLLHLPRKTVQLFHRQVCRCPHFHDFEEFLSYQDLQIDMLDLKNSQLQIYQPSHSSIKVATESLSFAIFRMLLIPSKTTWTTYKATLSKVELTNCLLTHLIIFSIQQITEGLNNTLLHCKSYLLFVATNSQITDGPSCLFLCLKVSLEKNNFLKSPRKI